MTHDVDKLAATTHRLTPVNPPKSRQPQSTESVQSGLVACVTAQKKSSGDTLSNTSSTAPSSELQVALSQELSILMQYYFKLLKNSGVDLSNIRYHIQSPTLARSNSAPLLEMPSTERGPVHKKRSLSATTNDYGKHSIFVGISGCSPWALSITQETWSQAEKSFHQYYQKIQRLRQTKSAPVQIILSAGTLGTWLLQGQLKATHNQLLKTPNYEKAFLASWYNNYEQAEQQFLQKLSLNIIMQVSYRYLLAPTLKALSRHRFTSPLLDRVEEYIAHVAQDTKLAETLSDAIPELVGQYIKQKLMPVFLVLKKQLGLANESGETDARTLTDQLGPVITKFSAPSSVTSNLPADLLNPIIDKQIELVHCHLKEQQKTDKTEVVQHVLSLFTKLAPAKTLRAEQHWFTDSKTKVAKTIQQVLEEQVRLFKARIERSSFIPSLLTQRFSMAYDNSFQSFTLFEKFFKEPIDKLTENEHLTSVLFSPYGQISALDQQQLNTEEKAAARHYQHTLFNESFMPCFHSLEKQVTNILRGKEKAFLMRGNPSNPIFSKIPSKKRVEYARLILQTTADHFPFAYALLESIEETNPSPVLTRLRSAIIKKMKAILQNPKMAQALADELRNNRLVAPDDQHLFGSLSIYRALAITWHFTLEALLVLRQFIKQNIEFGSRDFIHCYPAKGTLFTARLLESAFVNMMPSLAGEFILSEAQTKTNSDTEVKTTQKSNERPTIDTIKVNDSNSNNSLQIEKSLSPRNVQDVLTLFFQPREKLSPPEEEVSPRSSEKSWPNQNGL